MNSFELHIPTRIYFGNDKREAFFDHLKEYGSKVLLVMGGGSVKRFGFLEQVVKNLEKKGGKCNSF